MYPGMRQIFLNWKEEEKKYLQILNCKKLSEHVGFKKIIFGLIFASYWTWKKWKFLVKFGKVLQGMAQSVAHQAEVAVSRVRHSAILLYILTVSFHKFIYIDILEFIEKAKCKVMLIVNNSAIIRYLYNKFYKGEYIKQYQLSKSFETLNIYCNY